MNKPHLSNTTFIMMALIVLGVTTYIFYSLAQPQPQPQIPGNNNVDKDGNSIDLGDVTTIPFEYTIKEINPNYFLLSGQNGDMYIANDETTIVRLKNNNETVNRSILTVGMALTLNITSDYKAIIYISR